MTTEAGFQKNGRFVVILAILLVLWEVVVRGLDVPSFILTPPSLALRTLFEKRALIFSHGLITLGEILIGLFGGVALGVVCALLMFLSGWMRELLSTILVASESVPKLALGPIFLIWFGFGMFPKILLSLLMVLFPVMISTFKGLSSTPKDVQDLIRILKIPRTTALLRIRIPYALPDLLAGVRVSVALAVIGAILGEFLSSTQGLGYLLMLSQAQLETSLFFATLLVLATIGTVLFRIVVWLEHKIIPWYEHV